MTLSPYRKYMAMPRKYQFSDLVKRRLRALLGTFAMAMTSLKEMTWTAVTAIIMKTWPAPRAQKKPPIMTRVHIVRVMKFAFFFSYSLCGCSSMSWGACQYVKFPTDVSQTYRRRGFFLDGGTSRIAEL